MTTQQLSSCSLNPSTRFFSHGSYPSFIVISFSLARIQPHRLVCIDHPPLSAEFNSFRLFLLRFCYKSGGCSLASQNKNDYGLSLLPTRQTPSNNSESPRIFELIQTIFISLAHVISSPQRSIILFTYQYNYNWPAARRSQSGIAIKILVKSEHQRLTTP